MRKCATIFWIAVSVFSTAFGFQKESKFHYSVRTIAFYNLENLFDTSNDSLTFDDARTPKGKDRWTIKRYQHKIGNLARVISLLGQETSGPGPDIIGLCELENTQVIRDLFSHGQLKEQDYRFIHYDSPDERGIDVALAYRLRSFVPFSHKSHRLLLENEDGFRDYTRDILVVGGMLNEDELYILVNHWPSRSGGESRSSRLREEAAQLNKRVLDSIRKISPNSRIIVMGDFNDNPVNRSIKHILKGKASRAELMEDELFNPMEKLYNKGIGSLGYKDQWHLFDQILLSPNLVDQESGHYFFWRAGIFNPSFLVTSEGPYTGYPKRTYASGIYQGGFSDHFPVFIYLLKKVN
ncbi:endonuclease/exonuclease/phosphatase family protein [Flavobacteriaceae bacterium D16]|nr:endonuclease/exonuclease/phosphatase family protein [Flavobacteriaceae bacterium D16]